MSEQRRQESYIKSQNNKLPVAQQLDMSFKCGQLHVRGKLYQSPISVPSIQQQVLPSKSDRAAVQQIEIIKGDTRDRDDSIFVGYAARVSSVDQVEGAYLKVRRTHPDATHVMCAFQFPGHDPTKSFGLADDSEHGGARWILEALKKEKMYNCAVFVVCYYGGKNIGPDCFMFIDHVATSAINELQDIQKPKSVPWSSFDPDAASSDRDDSTSDNIFAGAVEIPNEGRASGATLLNPEYLTQNQLTSTTRG